MKEVTSVAQQDGPKSQGQNCARLPLPEVLGICWWLLSKVRQVLGEERNMYEHAVLGRSPVQDTIWIWRCLDMLGWKLTIGIAEEIIHVLSDGT